ncbi:MAG: metallophosphoesterase [Gallionella sp.]|nr:metallophosphoesterase [Gallionella sp.]
MNRILGYALVLIPIAALLGYGAYVEPNRLEVTRHTVGTTTTPADIRIVQISDLHLQQMDDIRRLVAHQTVAAKPDVIVLSGDIVDRKESLAALEAFLDELGPIPKIAVLGNWEYWSEIDLKALAELYARHHTQLLINACQVIEIRHKTIAFVGLDDALASKPNAGKAGKHCADTSAKVLIEHSPGFFGKPMDQPADNAPYLLSLSGHTHGGQITLFGSPLETPPGSGAYQQGWYETQYGKLYVSRGIGTTVVPLRIGAEPELPIFDIKL